MSTIGFFCADFAGTAFPGNCSGSRRLRKDDRQSLLKQDLTQANWADKSEVFAGFRSKNPDFEKMGRFSAAFPNPPRGPGHDGTFPVTQARVEWDTWSREKPVRINANR
jgi:hypothetical protein